MKTKVPVSGEIADIYNTPELISLFKDNDVVMNTTGPFYKLGTRVLKAATEAKVHCIDVCDDWQPTIEMLEFKDAVRSADICVPIGIGASPGVANMLAILAAKKI